MFRPEKLVSTTIAVLLGTILAAPAALADPPGHAPAHGWRAKQNQPYYAGYGNDRRDRAYGDRRGNCNGDDVGTVLGALGGGAIGSSVGKGDNRVIAILAGAAIGGVIGHQIGRAGDSGCDSRAYQPGRAGVPVRGYYPQGNYRQGYYPNPRLVHVVPQRRATYVVAPRRPVYAVTNPRQLPHRNADRQGQVYGAAHHPNVNRDERNCRRDQRGHGSDGRGDGKHGSGCR